MRFLIEWQRCPECHELWIVGEAVPIQNYKMYAYEVSLMGLAYAIHRNDHTMKKLNIIFKEDVCKPISQD